MRIPMVDWHQTKGADPTDALATIEAEGWKLEDVGYVFQPTGAVSRDKLLSTGQTTDQRSNRGDIPFPRRGILTMATETKRPRAVRTTLAGPVAVLILGVVFLVFGLATSVRGDSNFWSPATVIGTMLITASLWFFYRVSLGLAAGVIAIVVGVMPIVSALSQLPFLALKTIPLDHPRTG